MSVYTTVAKVIFYGCACIQNYENVEFVTNSPTKCETVIDTKELNLPVNSSYHSVLQNGDGYDFIFRNGYCLRGSSSCLYNTESGELINILPNMYGLNHNFCPFISKDGSEYYGIGGLHFPPTLYGGTREDEPVIQYRDHDIISPDVYLARHFNGLYLMKSMDLIHWEYVKKLPVVSGIHPGNTDNVFGCSRFDSKISCFYSKRLEQYLLFVRANVKKGCRWVQTTRSKDLLHWEPFELLQMEGVDIDNDNYYHFDAMEYPETGLFVGLSAYTNKPRYSTQCCIKLMFSKDGVHWVDRGSLLDTPESLDSLRNSTQTTSVFFDRGDYYDLFFNENYDGVLGRGESATVVRYTIPKDRLVGVKAADVGRFEFEMEVQSEHLMLNYDCQDDGYISFTINDEPEKFILWGNELGKEVIVDKKYIGQTVRIQVEMKNAVMYSCSS